MKISGSILNRLAVASILLTGSAQPQTVQQINIALTNYAFAPDTITMKANTPYRLHLTNGASKSHNFSSPEFFAASTVAPEDKSKIEDGVIELEGGQAVDVTVTPNRGGTYAVTCTHFMHGMMGMKGQITVQ